MSKSSKNGQPKKTGLLIWLEFLPFWLLYKIIRTMNLKTAYFLSRQLFKVLFIVDLRHRNRTIKHLLHAGITTDKKEAVKLARETFLNFSKLLVEIFKNDQLLNPDHIKVTGNAETIRAACQKDKSSNVIIVTAHYGNWELAGSAWAQKFGIPMVSIMRRFENPLIGEYILRNRKSDIHQCVDKEGGIKDLLKAIRKGKTVAILADQHAKSKEGVETVFFGQPCRTHASPALLHLKTGVPIVPQLTRRIDDDFNFEFVVGDMINYTPTGDKEKDLQAVSQLYTSALEKLIGEQPTQWMWAHRRWLNIHRKAQTP